LLTLSVGSATKTTPQGINENQVGGILKKTLYIDTETTGTDPAKHGLIQLACIAEIDGEVAEERS
jgi:DNA polymerase III epsilon subunit-like protein